MSQRSHGFVLSTSSECCGTGTSVELTEEEIDTPSDEVGSASGIVPPEPTLAAGCAEVETPTRGDRTTAGRGIASRDGLGARGSLACGGV